MPEQKDQLSQRQVEQVFTDVEEYLPHPAVEFVPDNAKEQERAFLAGEVDVPHHTYSRLAVYDAEEVLKQLEAAQVELLHHPDISDKHRVFYGAYIERQKQMAELFEAAAAVHRATTPEARAEAEAKFMELNIAIYGAPDQVVYESLITEMRQMIQNLQVNGEVAQQTRTELLGLLPEVEATQERFQPSTRTVEWMQEVAQELYGSMLTHIPERAESFQPEEVRDIFEEIMREEFGEAAKDWRVELGPAKSITVLASQRLIRIPGDRKSMSRDELRRIVCHEIGVHALRTIMGDQTDVPLMRLGFAGYSDAEEGLGKVMEQAINGKYKEAGVPYYLIAGLAHYGDKDFRQIHDIMWRYNALSDKKFQEKHELSEDMMSKAKRLAYSQTTRLFRPTDTVPWFRDLSYYNGTSAMWEHLEEIREDDIRFMFVLLGKANPADPEHARAMYETRTVESSANLDNSAAA